jgi:hypothetical protein
LEQYAWLAVTGLPHAEQKFRLMGGSACKVAVGAVKPSCSLAAV